MKKALIFVIAILSVAIVALTITVILWSKKDKSGLEIERKFLISAENIPVELEGVEKYVIVQDYVSYEPEIRIREVNQTEHYLTFKSKYKDRWLTRNETETKITKEEYDSLRAKKLGTTIFKTRYQPNIKGRTVAIDVYEGHLKGLAVAEVEFKSEDEAEKFNKFSWFLTDVTEESKFKNANLTKISSILDLND